MNLKDVKIGEVYAFLGGRSSIAPVRVLEKLRREESPTGKVRRYWVFKVVFDPSAWIDPEPLPAEPFTVRASQLREVWHHPLPTKPMAVPSSGEETIPLSRDDVLLLTRLAFQWDLSPQEAMRRALRQALRDQG